jgi:tetratricopeptide (TPR) repeat protein
VRIAAAMAWYWALGDQNTEGRAWMRVALQVPGPSPKEQRAIVAVLERVTSVFEDYLWEEIPRLTEEIADAVANLGSFEHPLLALAACVAPMLSDDREKLEAAVAEFIGHPDPWVGAMLHLMRGMSAENAGDRGPVYADLERAREIFEELGERWGLSASLNGLASLAITDGDDEAALVLQTKALELIREINAFTSATQIQIGQAQVLSRLGDTETARTLLEEVLEGARQSGSAMSCFVAMMGLVEHHREIGQPERSWYYLRMAEAEFLESWNGPPQLLAFREGLSAQLYLDAGQTEPARTALAQAYRYGLIAHDMPIQARVAVGVASYADAIGEPELAMRLLGVSENLLGAQDYSDRERVALVKNLGARPDYESCYASGKNATREENQVLLAHTLGVSDDFLADPRRAHTLRP